MRLAAQSQSLRSQAPALSALLAIEAVEVTRSRGKPVLPVAHESLFYALATVGGQALLGHQLPVTLVLISPDGHWLVTAGLDDTARLWDLTAKEPWTTAYPLGGHKARVNLAAFSPDSRLLVTGSQDGTARLWHLDRVPPTNSVVLDSEQMPVTQLAFSPSGRWLATQSTGGGQRKRLIVWDLNADDSNLGKAILVDVLATPSSWATAELIVTADGPWLVTPEHVFPYDGLRVWDLTTPERKARSLTTRTVLPAAISPNRHWLAAAVQDSMGSQLLLWDLRQEVPSDPTRFLDLNEVLGGLARIDFSDDDRFLAIGKGNCCASPGPRRTWFCCAELRRHAGTVYCIP
jgi:WD40 repeat protein